MNNPNSEALTTVVVAVGTTLPMLCAGSTDLGAMAGPHVTAGETVVVPSTTAAWLLATGRAVSA